MDLFYPTRFDRISAQNGFSANKQKQNLHYEEIFQGTMES